MSIKLEAGKCYRMRDGRKVGPIYVRCNEWTSDDRLEDMTPMWNINTGVANFYSYGPDSDDPDYDLVAAWVDTDGNKEAVMTIKLEVGKRYELNNGEVHECTKMHGDDPLAVDHLGFGPFVINGCLYHQDGTFADRDAIQKYRGVKNCVDNDQPKPVQETVALYGYTYNKYQWAFGNDVESCDTHCITFDVIDGKPDCASVKMEEL